MRAFLAAAAFTCFVFFEIRCVAQTEKPQSETNNSQSAATAVAKTGDPCDFQAEHDIASYPNCVFQDDQGNLFIAQEYLNKLEFDSHGLAVVFHEVHSGHLFMYVNRKGRVIIKDVPSSDNWAEEFSDGFVRIFVNKKYGFANRQGKIVIAPKYDGAGQFRHGYAEVCLGCRETCAMSNPPQSRHDVECEHHIMTGGEWFKINKAGRVGARVPTDNNGSPLLK
jgi:hypothetical protein